MGRMSLFVEALVVGPGRGGLGLRHVAFRRRRKFDGFQGCVSLSTKVRKLTISKIRVCVRTHLTFLLSFQHKWLEKSVRFQKKRPYTVQKS